MLLQQAKPRAFHPQLIENIAAEVFWGHCFRTDYHAAIGDVLDRDFAKLWSLKKAGVLVRRYGGDLSKSDLERLYDEINQFMVGKAERENNILGTLYVEDFARCRPPSFPHDGLGRRLRDAGAEDQADRIRGVAVPVAGDLLLRTPLPSCVLLKAPAEADFLRLADTRKALGFQATLLLQIRRLGTLPPNPQGYTHAAHGIFQIPCPDGTLTPVWFKLIPNATACREIRLF